MDFDYERDTRKFYQDEATAQRYHDMFMSSRGWRNLPSRVVASRERLVMKTMLARVPHHLIAIVEPHESYSAARDCSGSR